MNRGPRQELDIQTGRGRKNQGGHPYPVRILPIVNHNNFYTSEGKTPLAKGGVASLYDELRLGRLKGVTTLRARGKETGGSVGVYRRLQRGGESLKTLPQLSGRTEGGWLPGGKLAQEGNRNFYTMSVAQKVRVLKKGQTTRKKPVPIRNRTKGE